MAEIGALIGDPARAHILLALMAGQALTAGELADTAGVTAQTASGHLAKMVEGGLLAVEKQGRHRYYRIASAEVAETMETMMALAATGPVRLRPVGPKDRALRAARSCYDHIAGTLGVAIADRLISMGHLEAHDGAFTLTPSGHGFFTCFGLDPKGQADDTASRRPLCRACLDWSERRPHLAGRAGAALMRHALDQGLLLRRASSRSLSVTPHGRSVFADLFGITDL